MSKHSSAPNSDLTRSSLARASRSRRRRSKSTRFSQSTAIVPYVGRAITLLLIACPLRHSLPAGRRRYLARALPAAESAGGLKHGLLGRHGYIFQRRRERNWNMHRAHAFDRSIQIVECAGGDHRRKFSGDAIAFVTFVEN